MRWSLCPSLYVCTLIILGCILNVIASLGDPYKILKVDRSATLQDIRRAYKQLAKEWHPDKSKHPDAENKFVEIKQAYELLSDPERRQLYDNRGITEDLEKSRYDYSQYGRFDADPFDEFFSGSGFSFKDQDITFFHKLSITTRHYDLTLIGKSARTLHLLVFYTDWCWSCMQVAPVMRRVVDQLTPLGIEVVTVHASHEASLARRLSIHSLPCVVLLVDGATYVYKDTVFSVQKLADYIRTKLPYKLVPRINNDNVDAFLSGWGDNRVRGLIFEPRETIRLRYLLIAFHYRDRVAFGFVQSNSEDSKNVVNSYGVATNLDSLIIVDEDPSKPRASVAMKEIPVSTLHNVVSTNQYLALPRLSSQGMLEAVCPSEWSRPRKRLCAVLVSTAGEEHNAARQAFRTYARGAPWPLDKVRFTYLYLEKQAEFVEALRRSRGDPDEPLLRVVIIWRRDSAHIKYEWADGQWNLGSSGDISTNYNHTMRRLEDRIHRLLRTNEALSYETVVNDLLDEHAQGVWYRLFTKGFNGVEAFFDSLGKEHILPVVSVVVTILCVVGIGYFLAHVVRMEEEQIKRRQFVNEDECNGNNNNEGSPHARSSTAGSSTANSYQPELRLHEFRAEKYNGLVRLLKPGCRTIVLLVDTQSRNQLLPEFHRIVWAYRKNKTLMFAHMLLERGIDWYKELLQLSLPEPRELNINPRNCVGTVLALNGHRKYFCMFHAKHPESSKGSKRMDKMTKKISRSSDPEAGAFIGFESESSLSGDSSEEEDGPLLQGTLLEGLPNWLDRLFEGTTHRYYINYWPDLTAK